MGYTQPVLDHARAFVRQSPIYEFSEAEKGAITSFFTNPDRRVYFIHGLPPNVRASLIAMFSRVKNPRGIRGVWVDTFLPQVLACSLPEVEKDFGGDATKWAGARGINSLEKFLAHSAETRTLYERFQHGIRIDLAYVAEIARAQRAQRLLKLYLDAYGHNSIARADSLTFGLEQISILAAKSVEWTRPGSGYIELSTRYVDMSGKDCYPIEEELRLGWEVDPRVILESNQRLFELVRKFQGENFDGELATFLRTRYGNLYQDDPKSLDMGVQGETCDVVGNLLPASTLTSVGVHCSGEAFPQILKHLLLDDLPETIALAETIIEESEVIGGNQFARHFEPSKWERHNWRCLPIAGFSLLPLDPVLLLPVGRDRTNITEQITTQLRIATGDLVASIKDVIREVTRVERGEYDKLPSEFEAAVLSFMGVMSFRGWRDLQRMGFCTHNRTLLTTKLGFYRYDKPQPETLSRGFEAGHEIGLDVEQPLLMSGVPASLLQYPLAIGHLVGFVIGGNLRQWEFCNWQRGKASVNHEVRQIFLACEARIRELLPWWERLSRSDTTPAYVFARGKKEIPLSQVL